MPIPPSSTLPTTNKAPCLNVCKFLMSHLFFGWLSFISGRRMAIYKETLYFNEEKLVKTIFPVGISEFHWVAFLRPGFE